MAHKTSIVIEKLPNSNQLQDAYYSPLFDEHALPVPSVNGTIYPLIPGTTKMNNRLTVENHPIPDEIEGRKRGYIGYMCVQEGIPETEMIDINNDNILEECVKSETEEGVGTHPKMIQDSIWKCFGRILVVVLLFVFEQVSYGQGFLRTYPYEGISSNSIIGIMQHNDAGYLSCVSDDTLQYWLLDNKGHVIEKRNMQLPEGAYCDVERFLPTADGNYLVGGSYCGTSKINAQGDSIWYNCCVGINKSLPNGNYLYVGAGSYLCPNGEIGAGYAVYSFSPDITILNDTIWATQTVGEGCWNVTSRPSSVADTEKVLIAGYRFRYDDTYNPLIDVAMVSLTNFGQIMWRTVGPQGVVFDVKALPDGSYLVAAGVGEPSAIGVGADSLQIIKYSATGSIVWQKTVDINIPLNENIGLVYFLKNEGENEFILAGNGARFIVAIDTLGNKLWQKNINLIDFLPDYTSYNGGAILLNSEDSYLISGSYLGSFLGTSNQRYAFLARIDSTGSCRPQAAFSLVQTDSLVSVNNTSFGGDHYTWLWGDGAAAEDSTEQAQQYIYPQTGSYSLCLVAQNLCGSDTLCQTVNHFAAGIGSLAAETTLLVSPNPANEQVTAHFAALRGSGMARLYGSTGRLVAEQTLVAGSSQARFATQALPSGFYVLSVSSANWAARQRVVLRH